MYWLSVNRLVYVHSFSLILWVYVSAHISFSQSSLAACFVLWPSVRIDFSMDHTSFFSIPHWGWAGTKKERKVSSLTPSFARWEKERKQGCFNSPSAAALSNFCYTSCHRNAWLRSLSISQEAEQAHRDRRFNPAKWPLLSLSGGSIKLEIALASLPSHFRCVLLKWTNLSLKKVRKKNITALVNDHTASHS